MKKIIVLEDNVNTLEHIASVIAEVGRENETYLYTNVKDAYQKALEANIDLFIVDIILDSTKPGDCSGLDYVANIRKIDRYGFVPIIFITSLQDTKQYVYENLHCYGFVEKPFDAEHLKGLIAECLNFPGRREEKKILYFRKDGLILAVEKDDLVYAESINHIMHIHTRKNDVLSIPYTTLKALLKDIDSPDIIQCSRNTIINKNYIHNADFPNGMIRLKDDLGTVEIGTMYKKALKENLK